MAHLRIWCSHSGRKNNSVIFRGPNRVKICKFFGAGADIYDQKVR